MKMSFVQYALSLIGSALIVAILSGVARRVGLFRRCVSFTAYVAAILVLDNLVAYWPERFWNWAFWNFKQSTYDVLKFAVALELAVRALAAFPGSWKMARRINTAVLLVSAAAWLFVGAPGRPLAHTATIWLFAGTALVATYFHIPLHAWHRAILYGFTAYLTIFSTIVNIWTRHEFAKDLVKILGSIDQFAYVLLLGYWAYAAWRPAETFEGADPEVLRKLQLDDEAAATAPAVATQTAS